jgi:hypothetical protein
LNITYIDPITTQSAITVSGTINVTNYTVWVNGVMATNYPWDGTDYPWTAYNVPVNGAGTAVIQASAIPDIPADGNGNGTGSGTNSSLSNPGNPPAPDAVVVGVNPDKATALICSYFWQRWSGDYDQFWNPGAIPLSSEHDTEFAEWLAESGGFSQTNFCTISYGSNGVETLQLTTTLQSQWATNGIGTTELGRATNAGCGLAADMGPPNTNFLGPTSFPGLQGNSVYAGCQFTANTSSSWNSSQLAVCRFTLQTGGRSFAAHQSLHAIEAQAWALQPPVYEDAYQDWLQDDLPYEVYVPPGRVTILGQPQNSDGFVWIVLPDGEEVDVTPQALGVSYYLCDPLECKYNFVPQCQSPIPTNTIRTNIGVGEYVNLSVKAAATYYPFSPTLPTDTQWRTTAGSLAYTNWPVNVFTAPSNAANVTITTVIPSGPTINNNLTVLEPTNVDHAVIVSSNEAYYTFPTNAAGAFMHLYVYMGPTNVSFYRVQMEEVAENGTGLTGYFANTNIWPDPTNSFYHSSANTPFALANDNSWPTNYDYCNTPTASPYLPQPWSSGRFSWNVPWKWWIIGSTNTNYMANGWQEQFSIDANGTVKITKFGS